MGDVFVEQMVKRRKKASEQFLKYALMFLIVVMFACAFFVSPHFLIVAFVLALVCYYVVFPRFNVEYEYSYVNGEFDVDVIYSREKRKKKESFGLADVDCVAKFGSSALAPYQTGYTVTDYSAFDPADPPYVIVKGTERRLIYMQIEDATILKDMKRRIGRNFYES